MELYDERPISVQLPDTIEATIVEADAVVKGQTASSSYKPAVLDNGVRVMVPPHIGARHADRGRRLQPGICPPRGLADGLPLRPDHRHAARRAQGGAAPAPRLRRGRAAAGQPQGARPTSSRWPTSAPSRRSSRNCATRGPTGACCSRKAARSRAIPTSRAGSSIRSTAPPTSSTACRISRSRSRSRRRKPGGGTEITQGLVYQPLTDESFWAEKGRGAWLQDRRLRVSARRDLAECADRHRNPALRARRRRRNGPRSTTRSRRRSSGIRRFGSAALDLAWVAAGRIDGFWEDDLDIWDTAAGVLLVKEAGGFVTDYRGSRPVFERREYLAGNGDIHSQAAQAARRGGAVIGAAAGCRGRRRSRRRC